MIIQSVLFPINYNYNNAIKWLSKNGLRYDDIDYKGVHMRFRQIEPNKNFKYITKQINKNVQFIIAY